MRRKWLICLLAILLVLGGAAAGSFWWYRTMPIQDLTDVPALSVTHVADRNTSCDEWDADDMAELLGLLSRCKIKRAGVDRFPDVIYQVSLTGTTALDKTEFAHFVIGSSKDSCFLEYKTLDRDYTIYQLVIEPDDYVQIRALLDDMM